MLSIPHSLDALNFLSADVRNALGPFVNVYLVTDRHWSQTEFGLVATASGLLGIILEHLADLADGRVDAVIGVEEDIFPPDPFDNLLPADELPALLDEQQ